MRAVLAPPLLGGIVDERRHDPVRPAARLRVFPVVDETDDVVHLAHAHHEGADEVEPGFLAALAGNLVLLHGVVARDLGDGGEEEVASVGEPITGPGVSIKERVQ